MGLRRYLKNLFRHDSNTRRLLHENRENNVQQNALLLESLKEYIRCSYLQEKVMNCSEMGISNDKIANEEIIVSLTSYGNRVKEVYLAIESIMQGTVKPNRIVLWLSNEFKDRTLPITLQNQQKRGLQIEFCEDLYSYKKLIPTLQKYPQASIITIDDDIVYDFDFVENLLCTHKERPNVVCANRIHKIRLDEIGKPISYLQWDICSKDYSDSKLNFLTSGGGVLYPPNVFPEEIFNKSVFLDICRYADDVWFYAMLLMNDVPIVKSFTHSADGCDYLPFAHSQETALCDTNTNPLDCRNDVQIRAVFERYGLYDKLK